MPVFADGYFHLSIRFFRSFGSRIAECGLAAGPTVGMQQGPLWPVGRPVRRLDSS